jgi:hypothetical protein
MWLLGYRTLHGAEESRTAFTKSKQEGRFVPAFSKAFETALFVVKRAGDIETHGATGRKDPGKKHDSKENPYASGKANGI